VKDGTLSANSKFLTNLPFDYAMLIYEVEWGIACKDPPSSAAADGQITAELTEAINLTSASNTDTLLIDDTFFEERTQQVGAAFEVVTDRWPFQQHRRNFLQEFGGTYPTVAQTLNIIATEVKVSGAPFPTNGVDVFCNVWYTLAQVTDALRSYLTKRQQIQR
jgi:hypothetical protein